MVQLVEKFVGLSTRLGARFQERQAVIEGMLCAVQGYQDLALDVRRYVWTGL